MGLMDVLNGMMNGPRGQADARPAGGSHGGMSPLTMGLLALLAYKTMKGGGLFGGQQAPQQAPGAPANYPNQGAGGGGLDNWLSGLGGLLAGGAGGSVLSGGLNELLRRFQQTGQGHVADSWVGTGPNQPVSPHQLENALGGDTLDALSQQTGMSRDQVLAELTRQLPQNVDQMTPKGRVPSEREAEQWM